MNDRELLELAAKAAGYDYRSPSGAIVVDGIPGRWNPLTDDGDALRLAVDLGFHVNVHRPDGFVRICHEQENMTFIDQRFQGCRLAATRRAIVRAAAEIGKGVVAQPSGKELPEDDYYKSQAESFYGGKP